MSSSEELCRKHQKEKGLIKDAVARGRALAAWTPVTSQTRGGQCAVACADSALGITMRQARIEAVRGESHVDRAMERCTITSCQP